MLQGQLPACSHSPRLLRFWETMPGDELGPWEILLIGLFLQPSAVSFHAWPAYLGGGGPLKIPTESEGPQVVRCEGFGIQTSSWRVMWVSLTSAMCPSRPPQYLPNKGVRRKNLQKQAAHFLASGPVLSAMVGKPLPMGLLSARNVTNAAEEWNF